MIGFIIIQADKDENGVIDFPEFVQMMQVQSATADNDEIKEAFENDQEVVVKVQSAPENMKAKEAMEAIISMRIMTED